MDEVAEVRSHPLALGVRPSVGSGFVTDVGGGRLSTTRVLLVDGEADVADLPRDYGARPDVFCPFCGELGKYRHLEHREGTSHFAHATGDECVVSALETALHRRAKALLCEGLAWLRGQQRPVLVKVACLRCDESTAIPMLRTADWDAEAPEVDLDTLRLDVAALRDGLPSAVFEVRVSHAVEAEKASQLRSSGLPSVEFLATSLNDEATGEESWRFEEPLPRPEKHWNLEREGFPFALCSGCRELPDVATALAQVVPLIADPTTLKTLRCGLPEANEAALAGLDVSGLLGAWQRPEEVAWSIARRLAKVRPGALVSAESAELAELLANPYGRALEIAKSEREVPRADLLAADDAWQALKVDARRAHRDRRRQTHVLHSVAKQAGKGSTVVSTASLVGVVRGVAPEDVDSFSSAMAKLSLASTPLAVGNGFVGFSSVIVSEKKVLDRVLTRVRRKPLRPSMSVATDNERERAVGLAFTQSFAIITGGPGTGKTTAVHRLLECIAAERAMQAENQRGGGWLLCAPTHKALSRLKQGLSGFDFVQFRTAQAAVRLTFEVPPAGVLVDEASFLDSSLAAELLEKFAKSDQIILVGDPDQLPSVAPGAVLRDLIANFSNSVQRMTTNHRTEGRALAEAAMAMNSGRQPEALPGEVDLVELVDSASVAEQALSWYRKLANGRVAGDVQVLAGLRKTVGALNAKLQLLQNPDGRSLTPWLRAGDRVVVTEILKRELALGLHRGLMGTIHAGEGGKLLLRTDDGSPVNADLEAVSVEPSYAMTVHRSQGSEWPCVLLVLDDTSFLTRNLVYTAFTRARSRAVVLSPKGMLRRSLGRVPQRLTGLSTGLLRTLS